LTKLLSQDGGRFFQVTVYNRRSRSRVRWTALLSRSVVACGRRHCGPRSAAATFLRYDAWSHRQTVDWAIKSSVIR